MKIIFSAFSLNQCDDFVHFNARKVIPILEIPVPHKIKSHFDHVFLILFSFAIFESGKYT